MWRCPHCGTPQAESARCWVCHRSSTSCGTCRHFRRAVAANMGYCGLDRARQPLGGDEQRGCWVAATAMTPAVGTDGPRSLTSSAATRRLDFIEVGATWPERTQRQRGDGTTTTDPASLDAPAASPPPGSPPAEPGWSLWGDLDP